MVAVPLTRPCNSASRKMVKTKRDVSDVFPLTYPTNHHNTVYKQRITGPYAYLFEKILKQDVGPVATRLHHMSYQVAAFYIRHGELPKSPPENKELSVAQFDFINEIIKQRFLDKSGQDPAFVPRVLAFNCSWYGEEVRRLCLSHMPEYVDSFEKLCTMATASPRSESIKVRYQQEQQNFVAEAKQVIQCATEPYDVQGGGDLAKEVAIMARTPEINREKGDNSDFISPTVLSINCQTLPDTLSNEEILEQHPKVTSAISIVPCKAPERIERTGAKSKFSNWAKSDEKAKMDKYLGLTWPECIDFEGGANKFILDIKPIELKVKRDKLVSPGPTPENTTKQYTLRVQKYHVKKKLDGVCHYLVFDGKTGTIYPRTIDSDKHLHISGRVTGSGAAIKACIEVMDNGVFHVIRVYEINGVHFNDDLHVSISLEKALNIDCLMKCNYDACSCPSDGIIVYESGKTLYVKEEQTIDTLLFKKGNLHTFETKNIVTGNVITRQIHSGSPKGYDQGYFSDPGLPLNLFKDALNGYYGIIESKADLRLSMGYRPEALPVD